MTRGEIMKKHLKDMNPEKNPYDMFDKDNDTNIFGIVLTVVFIIILTLIIGIIKWLFGLSS